MISNWCLNKKRRFVDVAAQASVSGNRQIVALDILLVETDGMGCTVADHRYYGHTVGASYGKCSLWGSVSWFIHSGKKKKKKKINDIVKVQK